MIQVSYKTNLPRKIAALSLLKRELEDSRRSAMSSLGYFMMLQVRIWIETEGKGTWPSAHPAAKRFYKKYGANRRWYERDGEKIPDYRGAYFWLGKLARYKIQGSQLHVGFGYYKKKDAQKGKPVRFSRQLQRIAHRVQRSRTDTIDRRKQKLFGAMRRSSVDVPGRDFYPAKLGDSLDFPARPIMRPVLQRSQSAAGTLFRQKYYAAAKKRFERLK